VEHVETDCLFLSSDGKPLSVNAIKLLFQRLKRNTGISKLHAHLCRHTFAINYLMNGGDIFSLKEILGHRSLDMVNHYLHFTSHQIAIQHHKYSPMDRFQDTASVV
jgi:site-specific recombinase XerD